MAFSSFTFRTTLGRAYCTIRHDSVRNLLIVVWQGTVTAENRPEVWEKLLDLLQTTHCPYLLNDWQAFRGAPSDEHQQWLHQVWDEAAAAHGLRYLADVGRPDSLSQDLLTHLHETGGSARGPLTVRLFYNLVDAYNWLREQQMH